MYWDQEDSSDKETSAIEYFIKFYNAKNINTIQRPIVSSIDTYANDYVTDYATDYATDYESWYSMELSNLDIEKIIQTKNKMTQTEVQLNYYIDRYALLHNKQKALDKFLVDNPAYKVQYNEMMILFKLAGLKNK